MKKNLAAPSIGGLETPKDGKGVDLVMYGKLGVN